MVQLYKSAASLRIAGDALIPDEISKLLGASPTYCRTKGEVWHGKRTGREHVAKKGQWHLHAADREPADLDAQVAEILGKLTQDLLIWLSLSRQFEMDMFCGWFMDRGDEGISILPDTMLALATRKIELDICIYGPPNELGTVIRGTWLPDK
jgi:hypothetical protein